MEGRDRQDADAVRRSGGFAGRQVPLEMGKVRVGGSGRPAPALFTAAASRRAVTSSQEAADAALSPRVTLEPHPRSPFRRKEELSKTVVRVSQEAPSSHFQVKKSTGPYPLSARSPQMRDRGNRSTMDEFAFISSERRSSYGKGTVLSMPGEGMHAEWSTHVVNNSQVQKQAGTKVIRQQVGSENDLTSEDIASVSSVDLISNSPKVENATVLMDEKMISSCSEDTNPVEARSRKALVLPTAGAGAGTFVSSMPSLTKLQSAFTARELALFTQRLDTTEPEGNRQTRYHVASHPRSSAATVSAASPETRQEARSSSKATGKTHKRSLPSSTRRYETTNILENGQAESSWRRVDTSIDHIYEDPSIDMVQLHLLHSHYTTTGQKKRKMVERERVLAAASGLREKQNEEQRRQEQVQQRKLQLQKMSEAIRLQNQRAVRARSVRSVGLDDRRVKSGRHSASAPTLTERKPPVPRLSGNGKQQQSKRRSRLIKEMPDSKGGVSASILMGSTSNVITSPEVLESEIDTKNTTITKSEPVGHQSVKRRPQATTPRQSKKKKKQEAKTQQIGVEAVVQAREERRAIAREYMQLQKHSRRIWSAKAKEQSQLEREKRQQQLELLEATRLKNLRLSKKKAKQRKKEENLDHLFPGNSSPATVATSINCSSPTLEDINTDVITKPAEIPEGSKSDKELVIDEPHLDSENDQAIGNLKLAGHLVDHDTRMLNAHGQHNDGSLPEGEQSTETDDRVRKLLLLREKAAALTARLSGLRNRTDNTEVVVRIDDVLEYDGIAALSGSTMTPSTGDEHRALTRGSGNVALPNIEELQFASEYISGQDEEQSDSHESVCSSERRSVEADDRNLSSVYGVDKVADRLENRQSGSKEEEEEDDGGARSDLQRNRQVVLQSEEFNIVADDDGVYDDNEGGDIDVRSIGVYNIGVEWPLHQQSTAVKTISESKQVIRSVSASSSSSLSSAASSPSPSSTNLRRANLCAQMNESSDEEKESGEGAFEVAFYEQLKNRLYSSESATVVDGATNDAQITHYREESKVGTRSASDSDFDQDRGYDHFIEPTSQTNFFSTSRAVSHRHVQRYGGSNQSNAGLMRLIRETDDSLSVINRAAKKLFHEQRERSEREKEKELQKRIQAEKQELLRKDRALKAVMASLNGASSDSVGDEVSGSESDVDMHYDDENEMESSQYKRLEEIMDEVEKERAREKEEVGRLLDGELHTDKSDDRINLERQQVQYHETERNIRQVPVSPSSPAFWDDLVSESTGNEFENHSDHEKFYRPHVQIDKSELIAQRESQLREDDEQLPDRIDSPSRIHSPRTLSRRLMAAVDYQEAIYEAHLQLSTMEHAHELETVQAETITLAHAFKEEMEHNASTHQLALDHATLEKKFDGDMHDVLQQLNTVRQAEEQEQIANKTRIEQELRLANLRECSVQTEASQCADAATSAALCVDTSTSPGRFLVDAAVQHDPTEQNSEERFSAVYISNELEYASDENEDPYEETFEKESQVPVKLQLRDNESSSDVLSYAESPVHYPPEIEEENESEIQSFPSHAAEDDSFDESDTATSIVEQSFADTSVPASVMESTTDDKVNENRPNEARENNGDASASVDYEDDFEASSPKMKEVRNQVHHKASVEEDIEDELDVSGSIDNSGTDEDVEEQVDQENGSQKGDDDVDRENEETVHYSSEFEETPRGDSGNTKKSVLRGTLTDAHGLKMCMDQVPDQVEVYLRPLDKPELTASETADNVAAAYLLDLERRKQAEESLLNLRLQTIEQKFHHEENLLEKAVGNKQSDIRAVHEFRMRKETLTMAIFAEKANIESLKAASTARYYQDLHTFRSLSLEWPNVTSRAIDRGDDVIYTERLTPQFPVVVPSSFYQAPRKISTHIEAETSVSTRRAEEYINEFVSDPEGVRADVASETKNEEGGEIAELESIVSEHSVVTDGTSKPSKSSNSSEVAEEGFEKVDEEDMSKYVEEEEEQYEDEFVSMSEDTAAQKTTVINDIEVAESDQIADQTNSGSEQSDSEYDEDFASVSESTLVQATWQTKDSATIGQVELDIEEQYADEDTRASEVGEIASADDIVEGQHASRSFDEEVSSEEIVEYGKRNYSDDAFENEPLEQSELPHLEQTLEGESVSVRQGQSSSEDSSTTKLLVAEVAALQKTAAEMRETLNEAEDNKLARKKAKTEELLQAKYILLNQQKEAFHRDEERRQVDVIAKIALRVDVENELRRAKTEIAEQLASEFDALQQTYPIIKAATGAAIAANGNGLNTDVLKNRQNALVAPSVLGKLFGKKNILDKPSEVEDGYDDEYESESFEEAQYESRADSNEKGEEISEPASYEADKVEQEQDEQDVEDAVEIEDSNYEVASEIPSGQSSVDDDVVVNEKEDSIVSGQNVDGVMDESEAYDDEYENEYENESFDEAQSASDMLSDEGGRIDMEKKYAAAVSGNDDTLIKDEYGDEGVYSDEAFDNVSGSFEESRVFKTAISPCLPQGTVMSTIEIIDTPMTTEETSIKEDELVEAVEAVVGQFENEKPADPLIPDQDGPNLALEFITDESKVLVTSVSVSLSHGMEEESLTKSIEERIARLQSLRQKIADRKSEILAVQKKMRVEQRKEHLVAEERSLWDEKESVERLLAADEAALALYQQRNQLEMMHLEARQLEHSIAGRSPEQAYDPERDLLLGFDYVEKVQVDELQNRYHTGASLSTANSGRIAARGFDLLDGYIYIEAVEPNHSYVDVPLAGVPVPPIAAEKRDRSESGVEDNGIPTQTEESLSALNGAENEDEKRAVEGESAPTHFSLMKEHDDPTGFTSRYSDDDNSQEGGNKSFTSITRDADAQAPGANDTIVSGVYPLISQEGGGDVVIQQESSDRQGVELENYNIDCSSSSLQQGTDLLAEYAYIENADTVLEMQAGLSTIDLLVDFDFVEVAEAIGMQPVGKELGEMAKLPDNKYADHEKLEDSTGSLRRSEDESAIVIDHLVNNSTIAQWESPTSSRDTTIEDEETREKSRIIEGSREDEEHAVEADVLNSTEAGIVVDRDDTSPPHEAHQSVVYPDEAVAERVASLLYADLFQALEEDIVASIIYRRDVQSHPGAQEFHEPENIRLSRMEDIPTVPSVSDLDRPVSEMGSESIDSHYTADWSVEQSGEGVLVASSTNIVMHSEAPSDDIAVENEFDNNLVDEPVLRLSSVSETDPNKIHRLEEDVDIHGELSPSEELAQGSLSDTGNDASIDESTSDLVSSVGNVVEQEIPAIYAPEVSQKSSDCSEKVMQSERVSDVIFATVFNEILSSELRLWSRQESADPTTSNPGATPLANTPQGVARHTSIQDPRERDRDLADHITGKLEIVDGEIRLPRFGTFEVGEASYNARVLYETIEALARDCFSAIQQSSSTEHTLDDTSVLEVIHRHIQTEVDELLAIREQSERELERQLRLLSDESETDGGLTGDILLSQNCVASNVRSIVSKVQSELSRTTEALSTAAQPPRSGLLPHTPISRAKSTSILSSLRIQQDQELQQRITGMILSDLLLDAGLQ